MIRRKQWLKRSTKPIMRSKPIPKRRAKPRRGPLRCKPYRDWLASEGKCRACQIEIGWLEVVPLTAITLAERVDRYKAAFRPGYCDPAHTENGGMRMKGPDSSCAPLCRGFGLPNHHDEYDAGRDAFVLKYGYNPKDEAAVHWTAFQLLEVAS